MPADPFRLRVLKRLTQVIKDGVHPDAATPSTNDLRDKVVAGRPPVKHVFRGRDLYSAQDDPLPLVSVLEDPNALSSLMSDGGGGGDAASDWKLVVQGFVQDDPENPTDPAYVLVAEVIRAIAQQRKSFDMLGLGGDDPCVTDFKIGSPVVRPADGDVSDVAHFVFTLTLSLSEDLEKPFA